MRTDYFYIAATALMWGSYPLVLRSSGQSSAFGSLVLTIAGLVPIAALTLWQGGVIRPPAAELTRLIVAGVMMGCGLLAFNAVANSRNLDASISIPIVDTTMLMVTVICAVLFFGEAMTARKAIGVALLIAGILVLRPA